MDNYNKLLDEIKDYLKREEVDKENTNVEVISLYDLYKILNEELEELRDITINSKIEKKLNKNKLYMLEHELLRYDVIISSYDKNTILRIYKIGLNHRPIDAYYSSDLAIIKDNGINDIYRERGLEKDKRLDKFIQKNYNLILETLTIKENYYNLIGKKEETIHFSDDLFSISLTYNEDGTINTALSIVKEHPLRDEFSKNWQKREMIGEFAKRNLDAITKRIAVPVYTLTGGFKNLYDSYKEKNNQKVKTLTKISN